MVNRKLIEQLKDNVWNTYMNTTAGVWRDLYEGLSPIEQTAWKEKFDEVQKEFDEKRV